MRLNGEPFYGDDGVFAGFRGSGRDVTQEVEARAALASREALLAAVYESVEEGIAAFGPDMHVLAWNKRYEALHSFPPFMLHVGAAFIDLARFHAEQGDYGPGDREELVDARSHSLTWSVPRISNAYAHRAQCSRSGPDPCLGAASS